ncbi:MAG TPA: hypothetical protein VIV11_15605 [Kofleriaceae bacterium]
MRVFAIAFVLALFVAFGATSARAEDDPLAEAMRLEAQLDYETAYKLIDRTIKQGSNDRERLVTLHLFAGKLAAGLDRAPVAEDHFARVLALAPATTFAANTSPKITEPFDAARARATPLQISAELKPDAITIVPASDPLGLVAGIAIRLAGAGELREMQKRRIAIPTGARAIEVFALDAYGNRVWSEPIAEQPQGNGKPIVVDRGVPGWALWAGASFVALGGAGVCAWRFDVAQKEWTERKNAGDTDYTELQAIEQRGKRWALAANIGFGVAAATAIVAAIVYVKTPRATPAVTTSADSVGLAIAGQF